MFTVKQALSQLMWGSVISGGDGLWQEAIEFKIKVDTWCKFLLMINRYLLDLQFTSVKKEL